MKRLIVAALILILSLVFSGIILGAQNSPAAPANDPQQEVVTENNQESNAAPEQQNEQQQNEQQQNEQQQNEQQQNEQQQDEEKTGWLANMMNNAAQTVNNLESNLEKTVGEASQVVNEDSQTVGEAGSDVTVVDQTPAVQDEIVQDDTVGDVAAESSDEVPAMPGFSSGFLGFLSGLSSKDCPACEDGVCSNCGGNYEYCDVCEDGYCTECGGDGKL